MAPLITARELSRSFGHRTLFEGLSLTISEGDHVGVIGPNGAGKTTMLRILAGTDEPDAGEVHRRRHLRVADVPQDDVFEPGATVLEVVTHGAERGGRATEDETDRQVRVAIALDQLGFRAPDQPVDQLSGGWRKRLAIAAALAADPEVLLLDEPTNHLDLNTREALAVALNEFEGTVMLVSHDRALLRSVCDEFWLVSKGGVAPFDGDLEDYQRYLLDEAKRVREEAAIQQKRAA